jgi:hypothetical protein
MSLNGGEIRGTSRTAILAVFVLCFLMTIAIRIRTDVLYPGGPHWNEPNDHHKYLYIAEHPLGSFHIQPTCWRIGVPLVARVLPFSTYRNFDLLSIFFVALTGGMVYVWLLAIPRPPTEAFLGVLLFYSLGGASKLLLQGVTSPDPESYFFILVALYAIYTENDWLCALALAIGVTTKETVLLVGPLHYTLKVARLWDWQRFKRTFLVCLPCVCVLVAIRVLIPAWNDRPDYVASLPFIYTQVSAGQAKYDLKTAFLGNVRVYREMTIINLLRLFTYGSLGIQLFLPFFAPRANKEVLIRWFPYWLPILGSLLIALNPDRRLCSLFPVLIVMGLNGIKVLAERLDVELTHFTAVFAVLTALLLLKKDTPIVPFDLLAAVFLAGLCWLAVQKPRTMLSAAGNPTAGPAQNGFVHRSGPTMSTKTR